MLNVKMEDLEREMRGLITRQTSLETSVSLVKQEQAHLKELMDARLKVIEKSQEIQLMETRSISANIVTMGSDIDKTPVSRALDSKINGCIASIEEQNERFDHRNNAQNEQFDEHMRSYSGLLQWRDRVDGVLFFLKWVGAVSLLTLGISILRAFKVLP